MTMTRDQLRAARALLHLNQEELAALAAIGLATIRRYESGLSVEDDTIESMRKAVVDAGAFLIEAGMRIQGTPAGIGVALLEEANLPEETRRRLAAGSESRPRRRREAGTEPRRPGRPRKAKPPAGET